MKSPITKAQRMRLSVAGLSYCEDQARLFTVLQTATHTSRAYKRARQHVQDSLCRYKATVAAIRAENRSATDCSCPAAVRTEAGQAGVSP